MNYRVCEANLDDTSAMYDVSHAAHMGSIYEGIIPAEQRDAFDARYKKTAEHRQRFIDKTTSRINDRSWHVFVAKDANGAIVGFSESQQLSPQRIDLKGLFVDPTAHGHGIGEALFVRSFSWMPRGSHVELLVITDNAIAKHLYQKHGFVTVRHDESRFYGAMLDVMTKVID